MHNLLASTSYLTLEQMENLDTKTREILASVSDPEIPVLSILDMGIVKAVQEKDGQLIVTITPTYSGCPAMDVIGEEIEKAFKAHGTRASIKTVLSPAWTTEWIS